MKIAIIVLAIAYFTVGVWFVCEINKTAVFKFWSSKRKVRIIIRLAFLFFWLPIIVWGIIEKIVKGLFK